MRDAYDYTIVITGSRLDETSLRDYLEQEYQVSYCQIRRVRSQRAQVKEPNMAHRNADLKTKTKAVTLKPVTDGRTVHQHDVLLAVAELGEATSTAARLALAARGLNAESTRVHIDRLVKVKGYLQREHRAGERYPSHRLTAEGQVALAKLRRMQAATVRFRKSR